MDLEILAAHCQFFYKRLINGESCIIVDSRRDFIYIDDLIELVLKAINGQGTKGYYHVSSGKDYSIKELYEAVVDALGLPDKLKKDVEVKTRSENDAPSILLDPVKTENDFNWKVKTTLVEGVKKTVEYYKLYGVNETFTHLTLNKKND